MKYGTCIIIDRETGEILQLEGCASSSWEQGIRQITAALVDGLYREMRIKNAAPGGNDTQDGGQKSENEPPRNSASHYNTMEVVNQ